MALHIARASGSIASSSTFGKVIGTFSTASNVSIDSSGTAFYTVTMTAVNTSDPIYGAYIPMLYYDAISGKQVTVTLQEDTTGGGTWADTTATSTFEPTFTRSGTGTYWAFSSPYTPTTTSANRYRFKVQVVAGSGGLLRPYGTSSTVISAYAVYGSYVPGSGDPVWILGDRENEYQVDVDTDTTIGAFGSTSSPLSFATAQAVGGADLVIEGAGKLYFDRSAYRTLTVRGTIWFGKGASGGLDAGTSVDKLTNGGMIIIAQNGTSSNYGIQKTGNITDNGVSFKTYGADIDEHFTNYVSGNGTTGNELTTLVEIGEVGDEIFITGTNATQQGEYRFIKTKPTATTYTLSTTSGGAEAGLTYTHTTDARVLNATRGFTIISDDTTKAWYYYGLDDTTDQVQFYNTRFDTIGGGAPYKFGITLGYVNKAQAVFNRCVFYRCSIYQMYLNEASTVTWTDNIWLGRNSGTAMNMSSGFANKTFAGDNFICDFAQSGMILLGSNVTADRLEIWGCNNSANGVHGGIRALGMYGMTVNTLNINDCRIQAIYASGTDGLKFYNGELGTWRTNAITVTTVSTTTNEILFSNCNTGSDTPVANYLNMNNGSEIRFHRWQQTAHKHMWYTNGGIADATGTGLVDTTVRTAGSYNVRIRPENNTTGFVWEFTVKSIVDQISFLKAYLRKNTTMGTDVAKVELFMPGTDTTGTADAIFTASNVTDTWQDFVIGKLYSGTENTEALIRVTAISATAGAGIYLADFFDGVDALNSWFEAKPTKVVAPTDFTAVAGLLWSYPDTNTTAGTMGQRQVDGAEDAELASVK